MDSDFSTDPLGLEFKFYKVPELDLSVLLDAALQRETDVVHGGANGASAQETANSPSTQHLVGDTPSASNASPPVTSPPIAASRRVASPPIDASAQSDLHGAARHRMARKMKRQHKRLMIDTRLREARLNLSNIERANNCAVSIDHSDARHSKPGWIGLRAPTNDLGDVEYLLKSGYKLVRYEKRSCAFLDKANRVFSIFIDRPTGMVGVNEELCTAMAHAQEKLQFGKSTNAKDSSTKAKPPRRGDFPSISVGISYGSGQLEPGNLAHSASNQDALDVLLGTPAVKRTAAFQDKCYRAWMPRLHEASENVLSQLLKWKPSLRRNFTKSAYCCATFNFGPHVVCKAHCDHLNWAPGGCIITSGGQFDYVRGGHIVLVEAKLVIQFPPGCSILVPSACITHGNTPVLESENRISMTQYTAGGLVRWLDYGCRSAGDFEKLDRRGKEAMDEHGHERWKGGISMYDTLEKLRGFWTSKSGRAE